MERGSGGGGRREREKLRGSGGLLWGGKEVWGQREGDSSAGQGDCGGEEKG